VGLGEEWHVVREAYRRITRVYERANMLATLGNVDRWRREAVALFYSLNGEATLKVLDAGAGPGNMARHLRGGRYVVALDATPEMLYANDVADDKVVGVFEYMPFRDGSFDLLVAGYSLHAAMDLERAVAEFSRVAAFQSVVSIGKPTNRLMRRLLLMYTKYVLPKLVCLVAPKEICSEYEKIYIIVSALPPNSKLREIVSKYAVLITFREGGFGSIYIYLSRSPNSF
jgi:demethylmenaquinone methyltransferase/2-methoxy-6-polyprenyl-1,4-benzoquinol methylase